MRILVLESDPVTAEVLESSFPNEHEIAVFDSGRAALERIAIGRPFDAVFCEVDPPDMTAKEIWQRLTDGSPRTAQRLVFLVAELKANRMFLERPPKRYLTRPVTAQTLLDAMLALE